MTPYDPNFHDGKNYHEIDRTLPVPPQLPFLRPLQQYVPNPAPFNIPLPPHAPPWVDMEHFPY